MDETKTAERLDYWKKLREKNARSQQ